jgi:hypothetical protein
MNVQDAITLSRYYQQSCHRRRTVDSYQTLLSVFEQAHGNRPLESLQPDEIYQFLESISARSAKSTRRLRYAQLKALFNFTIDNNWTVPQPKKLSTKCKVKVVLLNDKGRTVGKTVSQGYFTIEPQP